jgi:DNA-binding HxlR family transcriptional regulator
MAAVHRGPFARVPVPPGVLDAALGRVGDRWSLLVVAVLLAGPRRFNDLLGDVDGIAPNVLSQRLKHLEHQGVVIAAPYSRRPPRFTYELTASGHDLADALRVLARWGASQSAGPSGESSLPAHAACGTALETRWYCPTCARTVDDDEGDDLVHV